VARLLLKGGRMRGWALLPLLASSGCLYLDGLNHAPTISIADGITSTNRGGTLMVHPIVDDLEDGPAGVHVKYTLTVAGSTTPLDSLCDVESNQFGNDLSVRFFHAGIYQVTALAEDSQHGRAEASVMVTITDAAPKFADNSTIVQTSSRDGCNLNPAGATVTLGLMGSVADGDMLPPGCTNDEPLTYTWRISDWPGGAKPVLTAVDGVNCAAPTAASGTSLRVPTQSSQVCLTTDANIVGATAMYSVVLEVSDGTSTVVSAAGNIPVSADEPPCITGTNPVGGSYVVDRTQLQSFDVEGAVDDRDSFSDGSIGFVWSVRRDSDANWSIVPSYQYPTYQLDPSSYGVGEIVHVRVEAIDRTCKDPATCANMACAPSASDCIVPSCAVTLPNVCHKWKTWDLELR